MTVEAGRIMTVFLAIALFGAMILWGMGEAKVRRLQEQLQQLNQKPRQRPNANLPTEMPKLEPRR